MKKNQSVHKPKQTMSTAIALLLCFFLLGSMSVFSQPTVFDGANFPGGFHELNLSTPINQTTFNDDIILTNGMHLKLEDAPFYIHGSIIVEPGCTLEQELGYINMVGKIVLQTDPNGVTPGAIFIGNGGSITGIDGLGTTPFDGIEVWGMNNDGSGTNQDMSAKAILDHTHIFDARVGVANCKDPGVDNIFGRWSGSWTGGIIQMDGCSIDNSDCGVFMTNQICYESGLLLNDQSYIDDCTFQGGFPFNTPTGSNDQYWGTDVFLANVQGVKIRNSLFHSINNRSAINGFAGFKVYNCTFDGCPRAVIGSCPSYLATAYVQNSTFTNCLRNIELHGYWLPAVNDNSIVNHSSVFSGIPYGFLGVYIAGCSGFYVEANTVEAPNYGGWTPSPSNDPALGMVISNAGSSPNDAYRNSFTNMDYAMQAVGQNRMDPNAGITGLEFLCSSFTSSNSISYDIISGPLDYPSTTTFNDNTGMARYQHIGSTGFEYAAGNDFHTGFTTLYPSHFDNALVNEPGHEIEYWHKSTVASHEPTNTNIPALLKHGITNATECGPRGGAPSGIMESYSDFIYNLPAVSAATNVRTMQTGVAGIAGTLPSAGKAMDAGELEKYAQYVNGTLRYLLEHDEAGIPVDDIAKVLEQTKYLYDYRLMLAKVYAVQGRLQEAIDLVEGLHGTFIMNDDEQTWMKNIQVIYHVEKELKEKKGDWNAVNGGLLNAVDDITRADGYFGRDMAKLLLMSYDNGDLPEPDYIWNNLLPGQAGTTIGHFEGAYNRIYPNPANDMLFIDLAPNVKGASVSITDIMGREVKTARVKSGTNSLDISNLSAGMYILKLHDEKVVSDVRKFTKH